MKKNIILSNIWIVIFLISVILFIYSLKAQLVILESIGALFASGAVVSFISERLFQKINHKKKK